MDKERLLEHDSALAAYQKGGMIKVEIDGILAPVNSAYEDEKARILGEVREKI